MATEERTKWINQHNIDNNNEHSNYTFSGKYLVIQMPQHHLARKDGYVYIHQLQAEKKLGRKLRKGECVHHLDENKYNNDISNLIVFNSISDHTAFHQGNDIYQIDGVWFANKRTVKKVNTKERLKTCPICNKNLMSRSSKMCKECYLKKNSSHLPTKEKLEELILKFSISEIGRMYNVDGNSIRKWCKKYKLPYKLNDIKLYRNKCA